MAAKAVVRDVGRVLGHPYGFVDKHRQADPLRARHHAGQGAASRRGAARRLRGRTRRSRDAHRAGAQLEGLSRNAGKHAGGVVIAPRRLTDFTPLYCDQGSRRRLVTQFDKDDVEADRPGEVRLPRPADPDHHRLGGADRSTARAAIGERRRSTSTRIPLDDRRASTCSSARRPPRVFQLESRGMKDLIAQAAARPLRGHHRPGRAVPPGPLQSGMVDDFIDAQARPQAESRTRIPVLEPILKPTYGVILYQEQVMQIAQVLAGYTLAAPTCCAARWARRSPRRWPSSAAMFRRRRQGARRGRGDRRRTSST